MKLIKTTETGILKFSTLDAVAGNKLAEMLGIRHEKMMRTIKRVIEDEKVRQCYLSKLKSENILLRQKKQSPEVGSEFLIPEQENLSFNAVFREWDYTNKMGRTYKTYIMNEDAVYLVVANSKSANAHALKVWFKSEFNKMRNERHVRHVSKEKSHNYTDEILLLQEKLRAEGSGSANFIFTTIQQKIHKKATGRGTKRGGVEHDQLSGEEDFKIAQMRLGVARVLGELHNSSGREARDAVYLYIKEY